MKKKKLIVFFLAILVIVPMVFAAGVFCQAKILGIITGLPANNHGNFPVFIIDSKMVPISKSKIQN